MNPGTYRCPYCCGDVPAPAIVCRHCSRDLSLYRPLALQLLSMDGSLAQLRDELTQQQQALARWQVQASTPPEGAQRVSPSEGMSVDRSSAWGAWLGMAMLTIGLLGLSHWVLFFVYDASPLALRVLTIVLPMLTGYLAARWSRLPLSLHLLSAMLVGMGAVLMMLAITARIDAVPLWPANTREWRETLEFTAAIVLGHLTGALVHQLLTHLARRDAQKLRLSVLLERDANGRLRITDISNQVQSLVSALAPLVSAGTALYSGLKIFAGD